MSNIKLIYQIPKAELHVHIEGTFEPELMLEIAQRNQIVTRFQSAEEIKQSYHFNSLPSFLDIFYEGSNLLLYEQDFYDLTMEYLKRCHIENVVHTEIFFYPQTHTSRGVQFETIITGISNALNDANRKWGITFQIIMCFLRHLSEEEHFKTLEESLPFKKYIIGVGLDSSEAGYPPSKFQKVFEAAMKIGFITVAHAGEDGPISYIWEALDLLKIKRIDHGIRIDEDEELMKRIIQEKNSSYILSYFKFKTWFY